MEARTKISLKSVNKYCFSQHLLNHTYTRKLLKTRDSNIIKKNHLHLKKPDKYTDNSNNYDKNYEIMEGSIINLDILEKEYQELFSI